MPETRISKRTIGGPASRCTLVPIESCSNTNDNGREEVQAYIAKKLIIFVTKAISYIAPYEIQHTQNTHHGTQILTQRNLQPKQRFQFTHTRFLLSEFALKFSCARRASYFVFMNVNLASNRKEGKIQQRCGINGGKILLAFSPSADGKLSHNIQTIVNRPDTGFDLLFALRE